MTGFSHKGKLVVIEGTDGAGKATQVERLSAELLKFGFNAAVFSFPRYDEPSSFLIKEFLSGKIKIDDPYAISMIFAYDRLAVRDRINNALKEGRIVILDRYVLSNCAYQGSMISEQDKKVVFINWLFKLEYEHLGLPKPDINLVLYVDPVKSKALISARQKPSVLKEDFYESDLDRQIKTAMSYKSLAKLVPNTHLIECMKDGSLMGIDEVASVVWRYVYKYVLKNPIL